MLINNIKLVSLALALVLLFLTLTAPVSSDDVDKYIQGFKDENRSVRWEAL
jgi:hypothetical protein